VTNIVDLGANILQCTDRDDVQHDRLKLSGPHPHRCGGRTIDGHRYRYRHRYKDRHTWTAAGQAN